MLHKFPLVENLNIGDKNKIKGLKFKLSLWFKKGGKRIESLSESNSKTWIIKIKNLSS